MCTSGHAEVIVLKRNVLDEYFLYVNAAVYKQPVDLCGSVYRVVDADSAVAVNLCLSKARIP